MIKTIARKVNFLLSVKEPEQTKDGSIVFFKGDAMSKLQEVKFSKAYCVSLEEEFDVIDEMPMQKTIVISPKTITVGDMIFENSWENKTYSLSDRIPESVKQHVAVTNFLNYGPTRRS